MCVRASSSLAYFRCGLHIFRFIFCGKCMQKWMKKCAKKPSRDDRQLYSALTKKSSQHWGAHAHTRWLSFDRKGALSTRHTQKHSALSNDGNKTDKKWKSSPFFLPTPVPLIRRRFGVGGLLGELRFSGVQIVWSFQLFAFECLLMSTEYIYSRY